MSITVDLEDVFSVINSQNFSSMFEDDKALLVQVCLVAVVRCTFLFSVAIVQFYFTWHRFSHCTVDF